jgi:nucleoside phosphorylase
MSNRKRQLIILARTSEVEDMSFYKTVLRENSPIYQKAVVVMFSVLEQVTDYLSEMPDWYEFSLLIHLGKRTMGKGEDGRELVKEIRKTDWGKSVKFEFTSRDGDSVFDGINVHHTNNLPGNFDLNSLPLNKISELRSVTSGTEPASFVSLYQFAIQTALDKSENDIFRHYVDGSEPDLNTKIGRFIENNEFANDFRGDIVLVKQQQMGMVDAAFTASSIIHKYKIEYLLLAGVCGGRKGKVKMFDIIIPGKVFDFSFGSLEGGQFKQRDLDAKLEERLINFLQRPENVKKIKAYMLALVDTSHRDKEKYVRNVEIHFDVMACGPWVLKTEGYLEQLSADKNNSIRGLEMESYSIGRFFELYEHTGLRSLVVKSVMDFTDEQKEIDLQNVDTKHIAGYMSYLCVRALLPLLIEYKEKWTGR